MVSYLGKRKQPILHFSTDYYLPKDEIDFYQFCYVDGAGQVRGASTPFRFRRSAEQNTESCLDENLIVTTQVPERTDPAPKCVYLVTSVAELTMDTDSVEGQYS